MKKLIILIVLFSFTSIFSQTKIEKELLETDKTLAKLSLEKGIKVAFDEYLADNPTTSPSTKKY